MSEHPILFGFGNEIPKEAGPMKFEQQCLIGANPNDPEGYWDTREEALINFSLQFIELAADAKHNFLFVRRAPDVFLNLEGRCRMIGRFSIAKYKE